MAKAMEVALFLSQRGMDRPTNTKSGNMILQKLMLFADLIHLAENDALLFCDQPVMAFKQGCVVESVRLFYRDNYDLFRKSSEALENNFTFSENRSLKFTIEIFGKLSANELSDLNHQFDFWKTAYRESLIGGQPMKNYACISESSMRNEAYKIKQMLAVYKQNSELTKVVINGITFYYNPSEISLDSQMKSMLENVNNSEGETSYTLTLDEGRLLMY